MNICPTIPLGDISNHNFFNVNPIINSSCIIRKSDAYWTNDFLGLDDYDMWFRLKLKNSTFYNLSDILCFHRIHDNSAFNNSNENYLEYLKKYWKTKFDNK